MLKMKWLGLAFFVTMGTAFAQTGDTAAVSSGTVSSGGSVPKVILSAGTGMSYFPGNYARLFDSGRFGTSITANALGQVTDNPLYVGLDFAIHFWGFANPIPSAPMPVGQTLTRDAIGIQFLPTALYRFSLPDNHLISPYFGFSAGPQFYIYRERTITPSTVKVEAHSNVYVLFQLMARPGVSFQIADGIIAMVEPKFGILDFDFTFEPQVSVAVAL